MTKNMKVTFTDGGQKLNFVKKVQGGVPIPPMQKKFEKGAPVPAMQPIKKPSTTTNTTQGQGSGSQSEGNKKE